MHTIGIIVATCIVSVCGLHHFSGDRIHVRQIHPSNGRYCASHNGGCESRCGTPQYRQQYVRLKRIK